jgi:hypothetical protein
VPKLSIALPKLQRRIELKLVRVFLNNLYYPPSSVLRLDAGTSTINPVVYKAPTHCEMANRTHKNT